GRVTRAFVEPLFCALDLGLLPVVYGDVVLDPTRGATVVSTEQVFLLIAREARRRGVPIARAVWLGETDGVYGGDGRTIPRLAADSGRAARRTAGAAGTDVTGGMAHRLSAAAELARGGIESLLIDGRSPRALTDALAGRIRAGTRVGARA